MSGLLNKRLVFVTGKGGVGKSTISAALALRAVRAGKQVLLCEVRVGEERLPALLGKPPVGSEITPLEHNIWSVNIETQAAFREYALMKLKLQALYRVVFENRLMRYALRAIPSIAEVVTLGKVVYHVGERKPDGRPRFDLVIVDAPATGHALALLRTPRTVLDAVRTGAMADEMQHILDVFADPTQTGLLLVTLPEEMPVNETIELDAALERDVRIERTAVVLNCDLPMRFGPLDLEALAQLPTKDSTLLAPATAAANAYQRRSDLAQSYVERLKTKVKLPLARVSYRFTSDFGRKAVEEISHELAVLA
jgi:anion-transporting  ArsA/GET3 family ATPase